MITINTLTVPHSTERLARALVSAFGGYTRVDGQGEWWDARTNRTIWEWVSVYTVAFVDYPHNIDKFRHIAIVEGLDQNQDVLFLTINGQGEFIDLRNPPAMPAPTMIPKGNGVYTKDEIEEMANV